MDVQVFREALDKPDLLQEVIQQLHKDLSLPDNSLEWHVENPNAYDLFLRDFRKYVKQLVNKGDLMSVLYRVDVPESQYRKVLNINEKQRVEQLADLILNRELKKVLTRRFYKG